MYSYKYKIHFDNGDVYPIDSDVELRFAESNGLTVINDGARSMEITIYMRNVRLIEKEIICKQ